ncbi:hypothetical protein SOCEGT47_065000 [Sorangium cellulosum]|uniref:GYF domain-containing protein n=1 Tax=Sorangium cellulosum TaxID=56 RepID=A0A4P2Q8M8_SORCE|nr:DUF4339 domain-containing protein [Sorangium cellulosum]AUX25947.1 hypothetical protein SOCEGT47_065000 [Sorangium cellulosum]
MSAWRWTDERGVQRLVSTAELRTALASGVIPGSTLVWRQGMKAWAPASRLPELADAAQVGHTKKAGARAPGAPEAGARAPGAPEAGARAPGEPAPPMGREAARESSAVELEVELVEDLGAARARSGPTPANRPANARRPAARAGRAETRPPPPPPRKREPMATLAGVEAPASAPVSGQGAPIVVPSAGGSFDAGVARAITQLPRYGGPQAGHEEAAAIPRAPKVPSASEGDAGPTGAAPQAAPQDSERDGTAGAAAPPAGASLSAAPPAPTSSSRGVRGPVRAAGRSVPPPPVPVRFPAVPAKRPVRTGAQAPGAPAPAAAGARALIRLGALPAPPPRPPAEPPRAAQPAATNAATSADAAPASSAADTATAALAPRPSGAAAPAGGPLPRSAATATTNIATANVAAASIATAHVAAANVATAHVAAANVATAHVAAANVATAHVAAANVATAHVAAANAGESPSAASDAPPAPVAAPGSDAREPAAGPVPSDTKRSPLPVETPEGRREYATIPSAGVSPGSPQGRKAPRSWAGWPPGSQAAQPSAAADALQQTSALADRNAVPASSAGAAAPPAPRDPARRAPPPRAGGPRSPSQAGRALLSTPVSVPVSSLLGLGGVAVLLIVGAFFAGRRSVAGAQRAPVEAARNALGAAQGVARAALPAPPKPCWVARQPQRWAPLVAKSVPFEVTATREGKLVIGYARSSREAIGLEIDPATGKQSERFSNKEAAAIVSISPVEDRFSVLTAAQRSIRSPVHVPGPRPFVLGLADGAVVAADSPEAAPSRLWPVQGDEALEAPRALAAGPAGYAVTFRRERAVWAGWLDAERRPVGELARVLGSGGAVGKPSLGWNGRELAVVFADRPAEGRWEIRAGRAASGSVPGSTEVIPLPTGGPGGDAFAPDIAGLGDGRWLLVWTEGPPGSRAMRAQTLAGSFAPIGDPIALSPPAGNFGQGVLAVSPRTGHVGVVFLSKPAATYELWGVVLQCG